MATYACSAIGSALVSIALSARPSVGASGAIFGLTGRRLSSHACRTMPSAYDTMIYIIELFMRGSHVPNPPPSSKVLSVCLVHALPCARQEICTCQASAWPHMHGLVLPLRFAISTQHARLAAAGALYYYYSNHLPLMDPQTADAIERYGKQVRGFRGSSFSRCNSDDLT